MTRKVILVTGCTSGLGLTLATLAAQRQHRVYAGSRSPERLRTDISGPNAPIPIKLDPANRRSVSQAVGLIVRREGCVDVLVNNAGYGLAGPVESLRDADLLESFNLNLCGPLRCINAVLPLMRRRRDGWIVNIGSLRGVMGGRFLAGYGSAKAALENLSESLQHEVRGYGIRVSVVVPGFFPSSFGGNARFGSNRVASKPYLMEFQQYLARVRACGADEGNREAKDTAVAILNMVESGTYVFRVIPGHATRAALSMKLRRPSDLVHERLKYGE